jgi:hypothetical protein
MEGQEDMPPPTIPWEKQPNQDCIQNDEFVFCLKYVSIIPEKFLFFYACRDIAQSMRDIAVCSSLGIQDNSFISPQFLSPTTNQSLGTLEDYTVGVIHTNHISRVNQMVSLIIKTSSTEHILNPLRQVAIEPHLDHTQITFHFVSPDPEEVYFYGPVKKQQIAFFRREIQGQPLANRPHVFFQIQDNAVVSSITQEEYLAIIARENFGINTKTIN